MALAVPTKSTTNFTTTLSCSVSAPASLAVGDLMIAHFVQSDLNGSLQTMTQPTGFTVIRTDDGGASSQALRSQLSWKVATAADVGATFTSTMTDSGNSGALGGAIARITGTTVGSSLPTAQNSAIPGGGTTFTYAMGITPPDANSLLLFFSSNCQSNTSSGYAIVTSNPTWTEQWDMTATPNFAGSMAMASAVRVQTTATGNASLLSSNSTAAFDVGQFISIFYAPAPAISNMAAELLMLM